MKRKHFNRNKKATVVDGQRASAVECRLRRRKGETVVEIRNGKTARVNDGTRHRPPGTNIKS